MRLGTDIIFGFITLFIFTSLNAPQLFEDNGPITLSKFFCSLFFLILWFTYGLLSGWKKRKGYVSFAVVFWIGELIVLIISCFIGESPLMMVFWLYHASLSGLFYLLELFSINISNAFGYIILFIEFLIPLSITLLGYKIGKKFVKK